MLGLKAFALPFLHKLPSLAAPKSWSTLDLSEDGIVLLSSAGQISEINTQARRFLNCGATDELQCDFWDVVLPCVAQAHQQATVQATDRLLEHSFVVHLEFEGQWLEYTFRPYSAGCVVNLKDVTTVQRLQLALADKESVNQQLFDANPNAMWIFDGMSQRVLAANQAAVDFYGISKGGFIALKLGALFSDGSDLALFNSACNAPAAKPVLQICRQIKGNGEAVLVELACSPMIWNDQQAMLVSLADAAERHLSDRVLRRENTQLKVAIAGQGEALKNARRDVAAFTYALSHDLQVPLHAANGFAAMLLEKYGAQMDDVGRRYIARILASTQLMAQLVDDLRTLVQLPQVSGAIEKVDVQICCTAIMNKLRARHPERVVTFEIEAGSFFHADKRLMLIALNCLLENAWKFTAKKADGWIKVAVISSKVPGEQTLQVSDNGVGFDTAYSDKLFTAFQRLHSSADYPGNGLGLVTVKRIAERHNGRVWATSTPAGASFLMAWPQVWAPDTNQQQP